MTRTLKEHLFSPGPKRILALDGGGIRGVISLGILKRIETIVGEPLSHYFDLIGGTSTGSIIAAGLAHGWPVDKLSQLYDELGVTVFRRSWFRWGALRSKFPSKPLEKALEANFKDVRLGDSDQIKTGLAIVAKRLDTASPWVLHNNPQGKYFGPREGSDAVPNGRYLVRKLLRASSAAPSYFDPEVIRVSADREGAFVDGGVSPHNNPALQLLLLATLEGYRLQWPLGENNLLIVSVGTGTWGTKEDPKKLARQKSLPNAVTSLLSMMDDSSSLNELLLQWLSNSPTRKVIDREIGDLERDSLGEKPCISYLRYDAKIELGWLRKYLPEEAIDENAVTHLRKMDKPENLRLLGKIGMAAGELVEPAHFPNAFWLNS